MSCQKVFVPLQGKTKRTIMDKETWMNEHSSAEKIERLEPNEVFVFGSNLQGHHGGGAAFAAYKKFNAKWGVGVGMTGQCYAIPTMQGGVETIKPYVDDFIEFAKQNTDKVFLVTRIGCGISGFVDEEIAPLFKDAVNLDNVKLPKTFYTCLLDDTQE